MANNDSAAQNVRFNLDAQQLEFAQAQDWVVVPGIGGSPTGADTEIQFNNNGVFGASPLLTWDGETLTIDSADASTGADFIVNSANAANQFEIYTDDTTFAANFTANTESVRIGNIVANPNSLLTMDSTVKGFLPPRMTEVQRDAIATPAEGLIIYNLTSHKLNVFTTAWEAITSA